MIHSAPSVQCPCGSNLVYRDCCYRFHSLEQFPQTATQLMRSRYSAFACLGIQESYSEDTPDWLSYLENTHQENSHQDNALENASQSAEQRHQLDQFARQNNWLALKIINRAKGQQTDNMGMVEFIAFYKSKRNKDNQIQILHEQSRFQRINDHWHYIDGDIYPTTASQAKTLSCKIPRNDLCWCDSEKKRKKCHPD